MTFARVKPGNWAVGEELTSAQMNTLDTDHSNAVDKTGDTISGTIHVSGAGKISADLHDTVVSTVDAGISTAVSHGVSINNDTGLVLEGSTSWPCFRTNRSRTMTVPPFIVSISTSAGWTQDGFTTTGPATNNTAIFSIPSPHDGATITQVDCVFAVGASHAAAPANRPKMDVFRVQDATVLGVAPTSVLSLSSAGAATFPLPGAGTGADYYALGVLQGWSITCDQNNVVDRGKYRYGISLNDEFGTNSVAGNIYIHFVVHYGAIPNMKFQ